MVLMGFCYTRMGRFLWGTPIIGEVTPQLLKNYQNKKKVRRHLYKTHTVFASIELANISDSLRRYSYVELKCFIFCNHTLAMKLKKKEQAVCKESILHNEATNLAYSRRKNLKTDRNRMKGNCILNIFPSFRQMTNKV